MKIFQIAPLLLLPIGCNRADVDTASRIGSRLGDRAETALEKTPKFKNPLQAKLTRKDRVLFRLRNDKALAEMTIEVIEIERGVKLSGVVPDERTKTLALELAKNTVDVDEVEDDLKVDEGERGA